VRYFWGKIENEIKFSSKDIFCVPPPLPSFPEIGDVKPERRERGRGGARGGYMYAKVWGRERQKVDSRREQRGKEK
jgi:hypothetical protein